MYAIRSYYAWRYLPTVYRTQLPVAVHRTPRDSVLLFYDATLFRLTGSVTGNPVDIIPLPDTAVNVAVRNDSVFLATPSGLYLSSDAGTTCRITSYNVCYTKLLRIFRRFAYSRRSSPECVKYFSSRSSGRSRVKSARRGA